MKNKLSAGALVVALAALGVAYFAPRKVVVQPTKETVTEVIKELGAIPGTEVSGDSFTINGIRKVYTRENFKSGTSTLCALPAPMGTSTLTAATVYIRSETVAGQVATTSKNATLDFFKATEDRATTTAYASSTTNVLGSPWALRSSTTVAIAFSPNATTSGVAGEEMTVASTTGQIWVNSGNSPSNTAGNRDFFVVRVGAQAAGDYREYTPAGSCQAEWIILQ